MVIRIWLRNSTEVLSFWIWRAHEPGAPWKALTLGTTLTIGGQRYSARPGVYDDF